MWWICLLDISKFCWCSQPPAIKKLTSQSVYPIFPTSSLLWLFTAFPVLQLLWQMGFYQNWCSTFSSTKCNNLGKEYFILLYIPTQIQILEAFYSSSFCRIFTQGARKAGNGIYAISFFEIRLWLTQWGLNCFNFAFHRAFLATYSFTIYFSNRVTFYKRDISLGLNIFGALR